MVDRNVACTAGNAFLALLCLVLVLSIDGLGTAGVVIFSVLIFIFTTIACVWGADLARPGVWDRFAAPEDVERLRANRAAAAARLAEV